MRKFGAVHLRSRLADMVLVEATASIASKPFA